MKLITIAGNATRDAEIRRMNDGTPILSFAVAVNGHKQETIFFDVTGFGKRWEGLAPYIKKGSRVSVGGDFQTREHEGKTYMQVRADYITLQNSRDKSDDHKRQDYGSASRDDEYGQSGAQGSNGGRGYSNDLDDEIPFAPEWRG